MATFVAANASEANTTSYSLNLPAGVQNGDLLIAAVAFNSSTATVTTPPSGWTALDSAPAVTGSQTCGVWYRLYTTGVTAPTWGLSAQLKTAGVMVAYRGVNQITPVVAGTRTTRSASSADLTAASLTMTAANQEMLAIYMVKTTTATTASTPAGMTPRGQVFGTGSGATATHIFSQTYPTAGGTGNKTTTYDVASGNGYAIQLALNDVDPASLPIIGRWGVPLVLSAIQVARFLGDPGVGKYYFGGREDTLTWSDSETAIANWQTNMTTWSGGMPLGIIRVFDSSSSITNGVNVLGAMTRHYNNGRLPHISFKLPSGITAADAAAQTGQFSTWMDSLATAFSSYAPKPVWWTFNHEPENDTGVYDTAGGAANYRAICRNIRLALKSRGVTNDMFWTTAYMCPFTFGDRGGTRDWRWWYPDWKGTTAPGSSKNNPNPADFYMPGDSNAVVDGIGLDIYSWWEEGSPLSSFESFETLFMWAHNRMSFLGLPYNVMEHGVCAYHTGTESGGTAVYDPNLTLDYLSAMSTVITAHNIVALQVYNYALVNQQFRLEIGDPNKYRYQGYGQAMSGGSVVLPTQWV
jgi:acyl dehydratase